MFSASTRKLSVPRTLTLTCTTSRLW